MDWGYLSPEELNCLDISLHEFARSEMAKVNPKYFLKGNASFAANGVTQFLGGCYSAYRGTHSTIRSCLAGLVLCTDMTTSCFMHGGPLINVMWEAAGYNNAEAFLTDVR